MMVRNWLAAKEPQWRSINDLEATIRVKRAQQDRLVLRQAVPIAVIDDQPFEPATNLRNNHYNVVQLFDIKNISELRLHPIILCDLQGVGSSLNAELQGAHLIREIKKHYPEKSVIAYTGIGKNAIMSRIAQQNADKFLKKDSSLEDWIDTLDEVVSNVTDPVYMWKKFRKRMLDAGITPFQLTKLEDAFVGGMESSVEHGVRDRVETTIVQLGIHKDLRAIIQSFIASLIFKALIG